MFQRMSKETLALYQKRLDTLTKLINLEAPSVIVASAFVLLQGLAFYTEYEEPVEALGMKLMTDYEGFSDAMLTYLREKRLRAAGFCFSPLSGTTEHCMNVRKNESDSFCTSCQEKADAENAALDAWEATPEGQIESAAIQAQVDMDFPEWADPKRPSC